MQAEADVVQQHRSHLLGNAYRLTGSFADTQDAVQDAWLRLARLSDADRAAVRDPRGWLTTVVGRLCLDRLRSAAVQRERYVGPWLPEPLVTRLDGPADPLDEVVRWACSSATALSGLALPGWCSSTGTWGWSS
ncbi:MAG: hypothetical protein M3302_08585, partial [Actinomycetota bacterium]|nr:hypothetical protein [Actinomycetota bacterium]